MELPMPTPLKEPNSDEKESELYFVSAVIWAVVATVLHSSPAAFMLTVHLLP